MTVVSTLDLTGLTSNAYRAVMDEVPALVPSLPGAPSAIPADAR